MLNLSHLGIEPFFDIFMENSRKNDIGCLICDIWLSTFVLTFLWTNPDKNDIECLICDIWRSSFC